MKPDKHADALCPRRPGSGPLQVARSPRGEGHRHGPGDAGPRGRGRLEESPEVKQPPSGWCPYPEERATETSLRSGSASWGQRTKPLRGGEDRDLGKGSASATRPTDSDVARRLNRRATSCYSPAWGNSVLTSVSAFALRRAGTPPGLRPLPIYSIYIKAKAVPVAASFSAVVSARPMRPDVRPRSVTALRIQDSSDRALLNRRTSEAVGSCPAVIPRPG